MFIICLPTKRKYRSIKSVQTVYMRSCSFTTLIVNSSNIDFDEQSYAIVFVRRLNMPFAIELRFNTFNVPFYRVPPMQWRFIWIRWTCFVSPSLRDMLTLEYNFGYDQKKCVVKVDTFLSRKIWIFQCRI